MAVQIVPALKLPNQSSACWRLVRGERTAHALVHEWPHGHELRVLVDGELRWAQLFRGQAGELEREAEHKRQQLEACGWTPAVASVNRDNA